MNRGLWLRGIGGAGGIAICLVPTVLVYAASTSEAASYAFLVLTIGAHRTDGPLVVHFGHHMTSDLALLLAVVPAAVTIWLLAPLAEYRRRDALMMFVPIWNLCIAAKVCARIVDAANPDPSPLLESVRRPSTRH